MSVQVVLGPSGSGKTTFLFDRVLTLAKKENTRNFIVVVPEQFSLVTTRKLVELSPTGGIMNMDVLSFNRLAHRIFDSTGRGTVSLLDDTGKNLILRRVLKELEGKLSVFNIPRARQGYISEIKSLLSEFIQYDIDEETIEKMAEYSASSHAALSAKLKDMTLIYRAFRERMGQMYLTREELLDAALRKADAADFLKGAFFVFDGFTGFTPIQYRLLNKLTGLAGDCMFSLNYDGKDGGFFELSIRTIAHLKEMAEKQGKDFNTITLYESEKRRYAGMSDLDHLERYLFRRGKAEYNGKIRNIRLLCADHPITEVSAVCSEIRELVRTGQYAYKDIAVVMSSSSVYGRLLKSQARRYKIPLFLDETHGILLNPVIEHLRSAIRVISEDFSYPSVFHYLRSTVSGLDRNSVDLAENYVRAFNLKGISAYRKQWSFHSRGLKEEELEAVNSVREEVLKAFEPLLLLLSDKKRHSAEELTDVFEEFICGRGVEEMLTERAEEYRQQGDSRHADEYFQIYGKLTGLFSVIRELIPREIMDLEEYLEILNAGFDEIRIGTVPPGRDVLVAADLTRSRLSDVKVLFFLGANEGLLPEEGGEAGILSDMDRNFLSEAFSLAPTARESAATEQLYFYMSITKPERLLVLSYSLSDESGKPLRPSWFIKSVTRLFPEIRLKNINYSGVQNRFTSPEDALARLVAFCRNTEEPEEGRLSELKRIVRVFRSEGRAEELLLAQRAGKYLLEPPKNPIAGAVAEALYGRKTGLSPSRLERFAACAYEHFLMYGMHLREREEYGFEKRDMGSLMHDCLAETSVLMKKQGKTFADLSEAEGAALLDTALESFLALQENTPLKDGERNRYYITRIKRILSRTLRILKDQQASGGFRPEYFEKEFHIGNLFGRIDRLDLAESGGKVYLSVIDYKSGNKDFDLNRVYYGLDLQLMLYLIGAAEIVKEKSPETEPVPGGIFYYHIDDPVINASSLKAADPSEAAEAVLREQKLRGVVNAEPEALLLFDDSLSAGGNSRVLPVSYTKSGSLSANSRVLKEEDFKELAEYVVKTAQSLTGRIYDGEINCSPADYSGANPCAYCSFAECCFFDGKKQREMVRKLKKMSKEELMEEVRNAIHS
ncbi:MAG: PD-(D/E)XK nuclease family protein [Lachnospiraceae bacterium]|nr:PD-(D/E)XK nuclease family protein [Lachnospiraceae bacterium]